MTDKLEGLIFYSKKIKDNDLFLKILTSKDQVVSGMVYGGNSSKKKVIFQVGYFINFIINQKTKNSPPYFNADISYPYLGTIINDKYKTSALLSIVSLINLAIIEGQIIKGFYKTIYNLISLIIIKKHWIVIYCEWLFNLLQLIGYEIDYKSNSNKKFYDIINKVFLYESNNNTIEFPHNVFLNKKKLFFNDIQSIFLIFESIFINNHLENNYLQMPANFLNFRNTILNRLQK